MGNVKNVEKNFSNFGFMKSLQKYLLHPYFLPSVWGLAIGLRLLWLLLYRPEPISDFADYHQLAVRLAEGRGYVGEGGQPTAFRPIGWPALLAGLYALSGPSVLAANLLLSLGIMHLSYLLARQLSLPEASARAILLFLALHPNSIAYVSLLSAELPFLFLLLLGSWSWLRLPFNWKAAGLSGILLGLASLVKSQGLLVPFCLLIPLLLVKRGRGERKKLLLFFVILLLGMGISVVPWMARNAQVFGSWTLVTNGGANLLVGNNPQADGSYKWGAKETSWLERQNIPAANEAETSAALGRLAVQYARAHPWKSLKRWPAKLWATFAWDTDGLDWVREGCGGLQGWKHRLMQAAKASGQLLYFVLWLGIFWQVFTLSRPLSLSTLIPLFFLLYFSMVVIMFFGDPRFHFPLIPWLLIFGGKANDRSLLFVKGKTNFR
jgi:4-amino-4-deoxy-L-arabinose transferase-like glycosyltransferase